MFNLVLVSVILVVVVEGGGGGGLVGLVGWWLAREYNLGLSRKTSILWPEGGIEPVP